MFSDRFGLTAAVINGTKTQTRRIVPQKALEAWDDIDDGDEYSSSIYAASYEVEKAKFLLDYAKYKVGEVVAVAQSYFDIKTSANSYRPPFWKGYKDWHKYLESLPTNGGGCYNKMFVRAELMPHQIKITGIRVERLQDISDEDCLAEGIIKYANGVYTYTENGKKIFHADLDTPRKAYAELIDKISCKGTWESNPFVFCYTFKYKKI